MYEMEYALDQVLASPRYVLDQAIIDSLSLLHSSTIPDSKKVILTPAHIVQLMFKSFLNGHALTHFRVGSHYNIFNIFFNAVKFWYNLDFLANLFRQMDLQDLMWAWAIDQTENKRQKIILFLDGVLRFFLQSPCSHDFKGVVAFINCAIGIAATMPEVNKGDNPTISRNDLIFALYNLLIQDDDLTERTKLLFVQGFYYTPPKIPQHLPWQMFPPGQAPQPVVVGGTTYFPSFPPQ